MVWKLSPTNKSTTLKQCWFPGDHGGVGGGDTYHGTSDIALAWMVQKITDYTGLEYNLQYLLDSRKTFDEHQMDIPWACETWEEEYKGIYKLTGFKARTPNKNLTAEEKADGYVTNEYVHKSVAVREEKFGDKFTHPDLGGLEEDAFGEVEEKLRW